jgi:transposase
LARFERRGTLAGMERNSYPTDLTDRQWKIVAPYVPRPKPGGRPALYARREIVNAILYQVRNGGVWRALPHDFPPYRIVFHYFRAWQADGTWQRLHDALRTKVRRQSRPCRPPSKAARVAATPAKKVRPQALRRGRFARPDSRLRGGPGQRAGPSRRRGPASFGAA